MSTATKTRIKAKAQIAAPQTKDEAARDIARLGELQRELKRQVATMNDAIGAITAQYQPTIEVLQGRIDLAQKGVQTWCEANRETLTEAGKFKTANLVTGEVSWRIRPPSVTVRGAEAVIDTLKRVGLSKFVRTKEEVNKEAILNERAEAVGIAGITIVSGVEDFVITPFEQEAA